MLWPVPPATILTAHMMLCMEISAYGNWEREYLSSIFSAYNFFYHSDSLSEVRKIWSDKLKNWWRVYVSTTADSAIFIVIPLQYLTFAIINLRIPAMGCHPVTVSSQVSFVARSMSCDWCHAKRRTQRGHKVFHNLNAGKRIQTVCRDFVTLAE